MTRSRIQGNSGNGAIASSGALTVSDSAIEGNGGYHVGGIANGGTAVINSSSVTTNSSHGISNGGQMEITNSVINNNRGFFVNGGIGGGIVNGGTLTIRGSVISNNIAHRGREGVEYFGGGKGGGISNSGSLTISMSSITNNIAESREFNPDYETYYSGGIGGGIWNWGTKSSLTIHSSTIAGNVAHDSDQQGGVGGGIANTEMATMTLMNTTVSSNTATVGSGITIMGEPLTTMTLTNVTIAGNSGSAGIRTSGGRVVLRNTIVAGTTANGKATTDCSGPLTSDGHNLIQNATDCTIGGTTTGNLLNVDPLLGPLQENGGPTLTHALLPGSPAIDAGTNEGCPPPLISAGWRVRKMVMVTDDPSVIWARSKGPVL